MGRYEQLKSTMQELNLKPKDVLRHWIITKEVDSDTLEDIFCGLEIDASLEPQVGWFAFSDGIFAPRPDVYPNLLGIIAWLNPCATAKEGERGIILIPKCHTGKWAKGYGRTGVNRSQDGQGNTERLASLETSHIKYPAASVCANYSSECINKGEAFLPAVEQLIAIASNAKLIRNAMQKLGKTFMGKLWSSTEYTSHYAYVVDVETQESQGVSKVKDCDYYSILTF